MGRGRSDDRGACHVAKIVSEMLGKVFFFFF